MKVDFYEVSFRRDEVAGTLSFSVGCFEDGRRGAVHCLMPETLAHQFAVELLCRVKGITPAQVYDALKAIPK